MTITKNGNRMEASIVGKLDTSTSPAFEAEVARYLDDNTKEIILDLKDSIYISTKNILCKKSSNRALSQRHIFF